MNWQNVREHYPKQWVLAEVIKGRSVANHWLVEKLSVVNAYWDVSKALAEYKQLHEKMPEREYLVVHTNKKELNIPERHWVGIRKSV